MQGSGAPENEIRFETGPMHILPILSIILSCTLRNPDRSELACIFTCKTDGNAPLGQTLLSATASEGLMWTSGRLRMTSRPFAKRCSGRRSLACVTINELIKCG